MKKLFLLLLLSSAALLAQTATVTVNCTPATIHPPANLFCALVQSGGFTTVTGPTGYLGSISASGFPLTTFTVNVSGTTATAGGFAQENDPRFVINWLNAVAVPPTVTQGTGIPDGTIATVIIPVPAGVTCPGNSPCLIISGTLTAATLAGNNFPVTLVPSQPVSAGNFCDVNGDGLITVADAIAQNTFALANSLSGDRNSDNAITAADTQIVINAVQGKGCTATK